MERIKYLIYRPAGNDTALVYGTNYTKEMKKKINDSIMKKHSNVEQVGFINNTGRKELQMAVGVMFCEKEAENEKIKINPIVWVKDIDTLFYETACGSGSVAVCLVESYLKKQGQKIDIIQPSGLTITANVDYKENNFERAIISGNIEKDGKTYELDL